MYIFICVLIGLIYTIPRFCQFKYEFNEERERYEVMETDFGESDDYKENYLNWSDFVYRLILPTTCLGYFNFAVFREVSKAKGDPSPKGSHVQRRPKTKGDPSLKGTQVQRGTKSKGDPSPKGDPSLSRPPKLKRAPKPERAPSPSRSTFRRVRVQTGFIQYLPFNSIHFSIQVKQLQKYGNSDSLKRSERKMVGMMVCTVTVFVVANSFHCIYFLLWTHDFYSEETAKLIWITSHLIMVVNCSVIVVIYSIFSSKFRAHFRAMLPKKFGGQSRDSSILTNSTGNPSTIKLNIIKSVRST